eukprot:290016-Pleurochrysis_carterae.AAC.12
MAERGAARSAHDDKARGHDAHSRDQNPWVARAVLQTELVANRQNLLRRDEAKAESATDEHTRNAASATWLVASTHSQGMRAQLSLH